MTSGLATRFAREFGPQALDALRRRFGTRPVLLLAGDQATGKSVVAQRLASALGGPVGSTGRRMREEAIRRGLAFADFNAMLALDPSNDLRWDYDAATTIAEGAVAVFESRLAGHLGSLLRDMGREALFAVRLTCEPRERLRRLLSRDYPHCPLEGLDDIAQGADDFDGCVRAVVDSGDPIFSAIAHDLRVSADRDKADRARIRNTYGFDYDDASVFDAVVDTTNRSVGEVVQAILDVHRPNLPDAGSSPAPRG